MEGAQPDTCPANDETQECLNYLTSSVPLSYHQDSQY